MPPMSLLLLFFLAIVGGSNAANAANLPPRSEIVPYDQWSCGASEFDKSLSHQLSKEDCPKRMYEADLCCVVHDICYMDEKRSQPECDQDFCHCLSRTVAQAARERNQTSADGCEAVSTSFCEIVKLFGGSAYTTARKLADKQKTAMAAWELRLVAEKEAAVAAAEKKRKVEEQTTTTSSTTTASPPSTVSSTSPLPSLRPTTAPTIASTLAATTTTSSPATIGQFITHQFPLDCFGDSLSKCTRQLQQCTSRNFNAGAQSQQPEGDALVLSASLAECSAQFCECASKGLAPIGDRNEATTNRGMLESLGQKKGACHQSLASICTQFQDLPLAVQRPTNVNIWSVNVNYIGQPISLFLAMASSLLLLLLLAVSGLILAKIIALLRRRFRQDESIRKNYAKTSIRRNTLTALRSVSGMNDDDVERGGPHYMPFGHQKDSTVSSPSSSESEAVAQKLLGGGAPSSGGHHHHKKAHSDVAGGQKSNNLQLHNGGHGQKQHLPLNSSQMHLIAGAGNSSTTLSDISSS